MLRMVYGRNDDLPAAAAALTERGVTVCPRNAKYWPASGCEACDEVVVVAGAPFGPAIREAYEAKSIPVRAWPESHVAHEPAQTDTGNGGPDQPRAARGEDTAEGATDDVDTAVEALFGRARSQGISKQALRISIEQHGAASVAERLGAEWPPQAE